MATYDAEREPVLRLERQIRPLEENDLRDMQSFCATLPYADVVIGENQFISLAQQAKLDKKYGTRITSNLLDLSGMLEQT